MKKTTGATPDTRRPLPDASRRSFMLGASTVLALGAAGCGGGGNSAKERFGYGVASGDPLADRVIIWTRANSVCMGILAP